MKTRNAAAQHFLAAIAESKSESTDRLSSASYSISSKKAPEFDVSKNLDSGDKNLIYTAKGVPFCSISIIPYKELRLTRPRTNRGLSIGINYLEKIVSPLIDPKGSPVRLGGVLLKTRKVESFSHLLEASPLDFTEPFYDPIYLDNPALTAIRNKTVITLPFFLATIIQPSKPLEIKKELNDHFRETHPHIDPSLTLSKIRGLKSKMLDVALALNLELSSVALAYVYLEKLVIKNVIKKHNRKLIAAICVLLAAKVNDPKELNYKKLLDVFGLYVGFGERNGNNP